MQNMPVMFAQMHSGTGSSGFIHKVHRVPVMSSNAYSMKQFVQNGSIGFLEIWIVLAAIQRPADYWRNNHSPRELEARAMENVSGKAAGDAIRAEGGSFNALGTKNTWRGSDAPEWHGNNKFRAVGEGLAVVAAGLGTNYVIDKMLGSGDAQIDDHWHSYLQGPAIAAGLLAPTRSAVAKIGIAAAASTTVSVAEHLFPASAETGTYSTLMKPNYVDSLGMSAAWMLPFAGWKSRALAVGATWAGARALNLVHSFGEPEISLPHIGV